MQLINPTDRPSMFHDGHRALQDRFDGRRVADALETHRRLEVFGPEQVALIEGAASRGHEVRIGGELFSDAMGAPGTYEGTYIGMIDHNVTTISSGLGGVAPERGMNGRLSAGS